MLTVFGVAGGVLMHRFKLLQQACETWVAAMASARLSSGPPSGCIALTKEIRLSSDIGDAMCQS